MKKRKSISATTQAAPPSANETELAPGQRVVSIPGPHDPGGQRRGAKEVYLDRVGAMVLTQQSSGFVTDTDGSEGARAFVAALRESVRPRDAVEEMLMLQMAFTHARLAKLSSRATQQDNRENLRVVNDACDRASNTFRRQVLALAEYRRPPRTDAFVAIKQANLANQQVVQNVEGQKREVEDATNEQGLLPAPAVPALAGGAVLAPPVGARDDAVAAEHGAADGGRQGAEQPERAKARRA